LLQAPMARAPLVAARWRAAARRLGGNYAACTTPHRSRA
jgi:hypothetical protein